MLVTRQSVAFCLGSSWAYHGPGRNAKLGSEAPLAQPGWAHAACSRALQCLLGTFEIWKYYMSISRVRANVSQNPRVLGLCCALDTGLPQRLMDSRSRLGQETTQGSRLQLQQCAKHSGSPHSSRTFPPIRSWAHTLAAGSIILSGGSPHEAAFNCSHAAPACRLLVRALYFVGQAVCPGSRCPFRLRTCGLYSVVCLRCLSFYSQVLLRTGPTT